MSKDLVTVNLILLLASGGTIVYAIYIIGKLSWHGDLHFLSAVWDGSTYEDVRFTVACVAVRAFFLTSLGIFRLKEGFRKAMIGLLIFSVVDGAFRIFHEGVGNSRTEMGWHVFAFLSNICLLWNFSSRRVKAQFR